MPAVSANAAIIGALMVLTPGVALTMGVRDILNGDYLSGSIRLLDALLIAGSIAGGVVLGWLVMARGLGVAVDAGLDAIILHILWWRSLPRSALASPSRCRERHYLAGGLTGAVGWMVYIFCVRAAGR